MLPRAAPSTAEVSYLTANCNGRREKEEKSGREEERREEKEDQSALE